MTSPAGLPPTGGGSGEQQRLKLLAVTACPTGIAHTYMAAEKLAQAAEQLGVDIKVETQGSIGAENVLTDNDVRTADGVIIAADKDVDLSRFAGKRVVTVGVAEGIHHPERLIEQVRTAPVHGGGEGGTSTSSSAGSGGGGKERSVGYKALMNGVSYMIPFVVVGGLLIAISLSLGGHTDPSGGLVIPKGSFWMDVNNIGVIGFQLMVPILSGYIAYAIGDRPALVPGMVGGWIANTGSLYDSEAGAGFIGAIVTGFLAGYLVLWIKKVEVPKFVRPIMPIIVIPIVATTALGLFFIYVIGKPISWVFEHLTDWLGGMTGTSAVLLGAILGLMIAFDMGGPVNKTAFLFGAGLIATGNQEIMGMCAAAIPVMPLGQGLATLIRKRLYTEQERETGLASLFMGLFGISEGAIPFAAARPAQVIPANMLGGAVAGALAGLAGVEDAVPHGGPIVAVLGAVSGVPMFFVAVVIGTVVTALTTVALVDVSERKRRGQSMVGGLAPQPELALAGVGVGVGVGSDGLGVGGGTATAPAPAQRTSSAPASTGASEDEVLSGYLTAQAVKVRLDSRDKEAAIREMAGLLAATGKVTDVEELVAAALRREEQGTTGLGEEIAIPHAKTDAVTAPVVGFARSAEGVEWGSLDGTKAKLVFMISVPEAAAGDEHLRILALLSRKLMDTGFRERLMTAPDEAAVLDVLREIR
ncbi:fructose-specific PTS transporter subunit EIIC [Streptomyces phaeochromogenes]|uniref:fructose-specific PTS transporter subunit EIIC n=1 Tax=Streptomyces phaeochromogenes TaxID=1923 RepID=UPI002E161CF0|nr:fructose-specific PTS transporter subunit EIIC [Streptomyces phaeochromogenes]